jgi:hypothetical protein
MKSLETRSKFRIGKADYREIMKIIFGPEYQAQEIGV